MEDSCLAFLSWTEIWKPVTGYCNGTLSIVNGTGIADSVVGQLSSFSVYLIDSYYNLSPVEPERLRVSILRQSDLYAVQPNISQSLFEQSEIAADPAETAIEPTTTAEEPTEPSMADSSIYNVSYKTEKAGHYEIHVFCGNYQLNGEKPFIKEIFAGMLSSRMAFQFLSMLIVYNIKALW
eukprot:Gb_38821 [translate_table: standard]